MMAAASDAAAVLCDLLVVVPQTCGGGGGGAALESPLSDALGAAAAGGVHHPGFGLVIQIEGPEHRQALDARIDAVNGRSGGSSEVCRS